jgi:hypothetical protein
MLLKGHRAGKGKVIEAGIRQFKDSVIAQYIVLGVVALLIIIIKIPHLCFMHTHYTE